MLRRSCCVAEAAFEERDNLTWRLEPTSELHELSNIADVCKYRSMGDYTALMRGRSPAILPRSIL